jgi:hypothetical protein
VLPEGLQQLTSSLLEHGDVAVAAAASASFKLLLLCAVIAWMTHRKLLAPATSKVLSQVSGERWKGCCGLALGVCSCGGFCRYAP